MTFLQILLQQNGQGGSSYSTWIMIAAMFAVVYFFMIRPQVKKNKEQMSYRSTLQNGDKVVTSGGIHGKIVGMKDTTMIIETEGGGRLKVEKTAISMEMSRALNGGGENAK